MGKPYGFISFRRALHRRSRLENEGDSLISALTLAVAEFVGALADSRRLSAVRDRRCRFHEFRSGCQSDAAPSGDFIHESILSKHPSAFLSRPRHPVSQIRITD
jgi:hypothetical protein